LEHHRKTGLLRNPFLVREMNLQSLAYRTDLIFPRYEGSLTDQGDYLVVATPSNPGFFWGNFLIFQRSPKEGDLPVWKDLFRREFGAIPGVNHMTFGWDGTDGQTGCIKPFLADGFVLERSVVMSASQVSAPQKYHSGVTVRPLESDADWLAATKNQILSRPTDFELGSFTVFKQEQMNRYRRMAEDGYGHWFGAFLDDQLVADLGIYRDGRLGRFQLVETHPNFRRLGICGALVHQASEYGLQKMGLEKLVMVADPDDHPSRIYASVGFQETESCVGLCWWQKADKSPQKGAKE
jgi:RimJ/RimL family protein N-acetyltransferase